MFLPVGETPRAAKCHAALAAIIADEKAHHEIVSSKSASASRPCLSCQNIRGRVPRTRRLPGPLVHWSCGDTSRWILQTPGSLIEMADRLAEGKRTLCDAAFEKLEQRAGMVYNSDALLWPNARFAAKLPLTTFWDWMHNLVASGGVAQYEVNQFLRRLKPHLPLDRVEAWLAGCTWPKGIKRKPRIQFKWALKDKDASHMKIFASELLQLIEGLGGLVEARLHLIPALHEEVACFRLLVRIVYLLRSGDAVVGRLCLLRTLLRDHHEAYLRLYPKCLKPKLHFLLHCPMCVESVGHNLSCFSGERLHRTSKLIANLAFRATSMTMTTRVLHHYMETLTESSTQEVVIKPSERLCRERALAWLRRAGVRADWYDFKCWKRTRPEFRKALPALYYGYGLRMPHGSVHKGDLLLYRQGETLRAAFMLFAYRAVQEPPRQEAPFLLVNPLANTEDALRFRVAGEACTVIGWRTVVGAVCWYLLEDGVVVALRSPDIA